MKDTTTIEIQHMVKDEYGYTVAPKPEDFEQIVVKTYRTRDGAIGAARKDDGATLGAMIYRYQRRYFFVPYRHHAPSTDYRLARAGATPVGVLGKKGDFISYTGK